MQVLHVQGKLSALCTSLNWDPKFFLNYFLPEKIKTQLTRRHFGIPSYKVKTSPVWEVVRLGLGIANLHGKFGRDDLWSPLDKVYLDVDRLASRLVISDKPTHVHCYEDSAMFTFTTAREFSIACHYELPIAYWRHLHGLLDEQIKKRPDWAPTLTYNFDSKTKLERKDLELELADTIFVPSKFVRDSLPTTILNKKNVIIAPFGTPCGDVTIEFEKPAPSPIRFLFVGSMGQRKGLADLLDAFRLLKRSDIELVILGTLQMPMKFYRSAYGGFQYEQPRPHAGVLSVMKSCHVLVLPSIVEGRALVLQEAMSQGLALIVTKNTGGEDLVIEGVTGHLVPPSNPMVLAETISNVADNPKRVLEMGRFAQKHARSYTWRNYTSIIMQNYLMN